MTKSSTIVARLAAMTLLAAGMTAFSALSAPAEAASRYRISVHQTPAKLAFGHSIRLGGKVSGGPVRGRTVGIYANNLLIGDDPTRVGTAQLSPHGYFRFSYRPPTFGQWELSARKAPVGAHAGAEAAGDSSLVYQWMDLSSFEDSGGAELEEGPDGSTFAQGTATMHGRTYPNALIINDGASDGFLTGNGGCKYLRGVVGVTSTSTRTTGTLDLSGDAPFAHLTVHRSQRPVTIQLGISRSSILTVGATIGAHNNGSDGGTTNAVAIARAQVWCYSESITG